jgi:hypothetical protein
VEHNLLLVQSIDLGKDTASAPVVVLKESNSFLDNPVMQFDAAKKLIFAAAWQKSTLDGAKHILFTYSEDGAQTWSASKAVNNDKGPLSVPSMAYDGAGALYLVWKDERSGLCDLYFNRSRDYGKTWMEKDVRMNAGEIGKTLASAPILQCDDKGGVYLAYSEALETKNASIFFMFSKDYGSTWSKPVRVNDNDKFHMDFPTMVRHPDGRMALAWEHMGERTFGSVYFDSSRDDGKSWDADRILHGSANSALEFLALLGGVDDYLGMLWVDKVGYETRVVYKTSQDFGATWEGGDALPRSINPDVATRRSMELRTAFDGGQTLAAVWSEYLLRTAIIKASFSLDRGANWLPLPVEISPEKEAESDYRFPTLTLFQDRIFIVFQRHTGDKTDVLFREVKMSKWNSQSKSRMDRRK